MNKFILCILLIFQTTMLTSMFWGYLNIMASIDENNQKFVEACSYNLGLD